MVGGLFGIHRALDVRWFSEEVAESSRMPLGPGQQRNGCGFPENDALDLDRLNEYGHPLLQRIFEVMVANAGATNDEEQQRDLLRMLSLCFSYAKYEKFKPKAQLRQIDWPHFGLVQEACNKVFSGDVDEYVGMLYLRHKQHLLDVQRGKPVKILRHSLPLLSRKVWELMLLPLRVFPEGVVLKEEKQGLALPLILRDDRPAVSLPDVKEDLDVATRLRPERLDRLVHPFPRMVIANVQLDLEKKANDDGKPLTKEKSLEKAIHEINANVRLGN